MGVKVDIAGDWDVEGNDFGGFVAHHRHWDGTAIAYIYPDRVGHWAECSTCGATLPFVDQFGPEGGNLE